jgi:hypothetical protein
MVVVFKIFAVAISTSCSKYQLCRGLVNNLLVTHKNTTICMCLDIETSMSVESRISILQKTHERTIF